MEQGRAFLGGLVGCGYVSQFHLEGWRRQTQGKLAAVCDLDAERAAAAADRFDIHHWYCDARTMFQNQRLDFVEICTRPESHEKLIELAAEHGVHVLCQKPIASDLATIDRMIDTCRTHGVRLMVHENWRFRPWVVRLVEEVRRGTVGVPLRLRMNAHDFRCLAPGGLDEQPYFAHMPRLILFEMGPHLVDVARQLFGEPDTVFCCTNRFGAQAGEDAAHLVLRFRGGQTAMLDLCWATAGHPDDRPAWGLNETVLEGTGGTIRTTRDGDLLLQHPDGSSDLLAVGCSADPRLDSYARTQEHFLECLATGAPFATDIEDNRRAMAILFAGYRSAATGRVEPAFREA